jgi:hypothetical protein
MTEKNTYKQRFNSEFLDTTSKARSVKERIDRLKENRKKLDFFKIKIICSEKDTAKEIKREAIDW